MKKQTTRSTTSNSLGNSTGVSGAPRRGRGAAKKNLNSDSPITSSPEDAQENDSKVSGNNASHNSTKAPETSSSVQVHALKDLYQTLFGEFSKLAEDAQQKLKQVEALEASLAQSPSLNLSPNSLKMPAIATTSESAPADSSNSSDEQESDEQESEALKPRGRRGGRPKSVPSAATISKSESSDPTEAPKRRGRQPAVKTESEAPRRRGGMKLIKPYQDSTMLDALQKALEERKGSVVSADTLVEALYGDQLKPDQFKLAKDRVTKSLSKGKIENRWDRVPDKIGCYTIAMKLLEL